MPVKATNENGEEFDAYTPEEITAIKAEYEKNTSEAKKEAETARVEAEALKKVTAEKTENFKRLNELTEKERAEMSVKEIENLKRIEAAEARAKALEDKMNEGENNRIKTDKEKALFKYHGGNKELKEALEKNFDLINLVGNSTEIIEERARLAANMEKGKIGYANPLYSNLSGGAPREANKNATEKFFESDKAKAALKLMGDEPKK